MRTILFPLLLIACFLVTKTYSIADDSDLLPCPGRGCPEEQTEKAASAATGLQPVFFDFDKSFIRNDAKSVMKANAEWLKANQKVRIRIESNCDDRGSTEYNQALGQRRAASAKKYLSALGVSGKRIALISFGKEKPICSDQTEDCWQKNRRVDFVAE